ncbi:MAG: NADAR family protein, partial [Chloroflexota bacterium]
MTMKIARFRDDYEFLSNFYPSPIEMDGMTYPTVEHAYQAAKTDNEAVRRKIAELAHPGAAKAAGRRLARPDNWFEINLQLMEDLVRQKFTAHADLRNKLLATGDAELIEGNSWSDKFFGMTWDKNKNVLSGENHLGQILMRVRVEL